MAAPKRGDGAKRRPDERALIRAIRKRDLTRLKECIAAGVDPNCGDENSEMSALMEAAEAGFVDGIRELLAAGARLEDHGPDHYTPLFLAMEAGEYAATAALIEAGADRAHYTVEQCLQWARDRRKELDERNRVASDKNAKALLKAVLFTETPDKLHKLLAGGANPNTYDSSGRSPLCHAVASVLHGRHKPASWDAMARLRMLIEAGADPNYLPKPDSNASPLLDAVTHGLDDVARMLIDAGANVQGPRSQGRPLREAAEMGHIAMVQLLLDRGADLQGQTAAHWLELAKKNRSWRDRLANMGPDDDLDQVLAGEG